MNKLKIFDADYIQCVTHQENMTTDEEINNHKSDDCMMVPMNFVIKNTKRRRIHYLPKNVIEHCGLKIYHDDSLTVRDKMYTVPTGHMILTGDLDEYIRTKGGMIE